MIDLNGYVLHPRGELIKINPGGTLINPEGTFPVRVSVSTRKILVKYV